MNYLAVGSSNGKEEFINKDLIQVYLMENLQLRNTNLIYTKKFKNMEMIMKKIK